MSVQRPCSPARDVCWAAVPNCHRQAAYTANLTSHRLEAGGPAGLWREPSPRLQTAGLLTVSSRGGRRDGKPALS